MTYITIKHFLLILFVVLCNTMHAQFSYNEPITFDEYRQPQQKHELNIKYNEYAKNETVLIASGALFMCLALSTPKESANQKIYQHIPKFVALVSGGVLLTTGIVIYINKPSRR